MYLFTSLSKLKNDVQHDNANGNCCHQQAGIQSYKHKKKTNDKMLMSCATKQTTAKSKQMRQWNTLAFCCIFLALYVSTRKKRKKAHPVYDYNNVSWLTHNKTKIKDEKGTWQCWS